MEPIKNALSQAGNAIQQAAHTVVEAIRGGDSEETTTKDNVGVFICSINKQYLIYRLNKKKKNIMKLMIQNPREKIMIVMMMKKRKKILIVNKENSKKNKMLLFKKVK